MLFEIKTADGQTHVGVPWGSGGPLGGGAAHKGIDAEASAAVRELRRLIKVGETILLKPEGYGVIDHHLIKGLSKHVELYGATFHLLPGTGWGFSEDRRATS